MPAAVAATAVPIILDYGIKYGPIAAELVKGILESMVSGTPPSDEMYQKLFDEMKKQRTSSYHDLIPNSNLPKDE